MDNEFRLAVIEGEVERARVLSGDPSRADADDAGMTCWHYAAQHNDVAMLSYLLERSDRGALLRATNNRGNTALHQAALSGSVDTLKFIVQLKLSGEELNVRNNWLETPLHLACQAASEGCIQVLMKELHVDLTAQDKWERTPNDVYLEHTAGKLGLAKETVVDKTAAKANSSSAVVVRSLSKLIEAPLSMELFESLLNDASVNPWGKDMFGLTALMKASAWNSERAVALLLALDSASSAVVNSTDAEGNTALHHAALLGANRTYMLLSQHHLCNIELLNKHGKRALDLIQLV